MAILIMSVVTLAWAVLFVLPLVAYAALGMGLIKLDADAKPGSRVENKPVLVPSFTH